MFVGVVAVVTGCAGSADRPGARDVRRAKFPVAFMIDGAGRLVYAERLTGRVRQLRGSGLVSRPLARVKVSTKGQRGLLGVATDQSSRIFVAFTATGPDRRIEVAQVAPTFRTVWIGPPSATLANGGHLVYDAARRRLIVGIGDLQAPAKVADPDTPNGKLLLLDPDGEPTQRPDVLSTGWNNPFAFARTRAGEIWVADNVPGDRGERLARGDLDGRPTSVTRLPANTVPAALTSPATDTLIVCSYARSRTLRFEIRAGRARRSPGFGDEVPCRTAIAAAGDVLWVADEDSIRRLTAP